MKSIAKESKRWSKLAASTLVAVSLAGCSGVDGSPEGSEELEGADATEHVAASKSALTAYTFGIGSGISSSDLKVAMVDNSEPFFLGGGYPGNSYVQGTYSERFTRYPEALWSQSTQQSTVPWLRSVGLFDNEQVWQTWYVDTSATITICNAPGYIPRTFSTPWAVSMDYEVDSEVGYDWLVITSTGTCGTTVQRVKESGKKSGSLSFELPRDCPSAYVTVSYMKDVSLASGLDMGRVKNVQFVRQIPPVICVKG